MFRWFTLPKKENAENEEEFDMSATLSLEGVDFLDYDPEFERKFSERSRNLKY